MPESTTYTVAPPRGTKILIHSNGPTISTGYGVQTRHLADRLAAEGYEVAISCTYGHQGPVSTWKSPSGHTVRLYPSGYETNSPDVIIGHAEHWFEGDPSNGWIILLIDTWCFERPQLMQTLRESFQVAAWCPIDHFPAPRGVLNFLQGSGAVPVAMSRFGAHQLVQAGLDPAYVPLSVDTSAYKPTYTVEIDGATVNARELYDLPMGAFVVGMVAMNKGWARDRKGFGEAFQAFGRFWREHQHAVLFVHSEKFGVAEGINLVELAAFCGVPAHAIVFSDQYSYRLGLPPELMAAAYTAMDVLLAPSHGEGFCVPLIEAQACGVPVIASDFSAQPELVGVGWTVGGQLEWDPAQHSWYQTPFVEEIHARLCEAHDSDLGEMQAKAIEFAAAYDKDTVFDEFWKPFLATLEPPESRVREPFKTVDVVVPVMRLAKFDSLVASLIPPPEGVHVIAVHDGDAWRGADGNFITTLGTGKETTTYAEKVNLAARASTADAVLIVGDDTTFAPGWYEALVEASIHGDVIGTNDSEEGRIRNPDVAAGRHADHFAIRRTYIDEDGSTLAGPGVVANEAFGHWYVDREIIQLAKARGVYFHAPECRIIHHHPGYDGREDLREADPVYMKAVATRDADEQTWLSIAPLIEGHRITRVKA